MKTIDEFKQLNHNEMFDTGVLPNSPKGLFMTDTGGFLRWVAVKGRIDDWSVYCHWDDKPPSWIEQHGDKVCSEKHIKMCVPCDDEVFKLYRY